ncbi:MAG: PorT family protein, partial [Sphingobacteriaceae bacterium]
MIKTFYSAVILICCSSIAYAQKPPSWGGGADVTDLSFGFSFTYVSSYLKIDKKPGWREPFVDPEDGAILTG